MSGAEAQDESLVLLGLVAYGELASFARLAADAQLAPDLAGRAEVSALAAVEMEHYVRVRDHLAARGVDVLDAMAPFVARVDRLLASVGGRDWAEALVATTLGRGLVVDLQTEALAGLSGAEADLVREVIPDGGHATFAEVRLREACADEQVRARLAMWARRLLGEALAAVAAALDDHPAIGSLTDDRAGVAKRLKSAHRERVAALGL